MGETWTPDHRQEAVDVWFDGFPAQARAHFYLCRVWHFFVACSKPHWFPGQLLRLVVVWILSIAAWLLALFFFFFCEVLSYQDEVADSINFKSCKVSSQGDLRGGRFLYRTKVMKRNRSVALSALVDIPHDNPSCLNLDNFWVFQLQQNSFGC